jgi:arylsulfatase A-like enzyme
LLTGEYPFREKGFFAPLFLREPLIVDTTKTTIAKVLKEAGYSTACIGKWHLGFGSQRPTDWNKELKPGPLELGFDYYFGIPVVNSHPPFVYVENHHVVGYDPEDPFIYGETAETETYREKFRVDDIGGAKAAHALYRDRSVGTTLKKKAVDWITEQQDRPFFLYFATTNIHHPFTPAPRFDGTSQCGIYGDFIHELDWIVGEVLATLKELELTENTLVIFTSDNGGMLNMGGQEAWAQGHRLNGDLLGFKFDAWEGGHRIPFIARWPGKIPAGSVSDQLISNVDILATFAAIVSRPLAPEEGKDSFNVLPALTGASNEQIRDHLVISPVSEQHVALRKGSWLYIGARGAGGFRGTRIGEHTLGGPAAHLLTFQVNSDVVNGKLRNDAPPAQLYDLSSDPSQKENLYGKRPDIVERMREDLALKLKAERTAPIR